MRTAGESFFDERAEAALAKPGKASGTPRAARVLLFLGDDWLVDRVLDTIVPPKDWISGKAFDFACQDRLLLFDWIAGSRGC